MADKTKPLVDIDINNIFFQLHQIASQRAKEAASNIDITNLGVDTKNETYVGTGDFLIIASAKDLKNPGEADKLKGDCLKAINAYTEFFIDKKNFTESDLNVLQMSVPKDSTKTESTRFDFTMSLLENLFEADTSDDVSDDDKETMKLSADSTADLPETVAVGYSLPYACQIAGQKKHPLADRIKEEAKSAKNLASELLKLAVSPVSAIAKNAAGVAGSAAKGIIDLGYGLGKSILGNTLSDIASLKIGTFGNNSIGVGAAVDAGKAVGKAAKDAAVGTASAVGKAAKDAAVDAKAAARKALGKLVGKVKREFSKKDLDTIQHDMYKELNKEYPNNLLDIYIYKTDQLINRIQKQKKMTSALKAELLKNGLLSRMEYCIGVIANSNDENYDSYNEEMIADAFTKACGHADNPFLKGGVTKDDVYKISDYSTDFKTSTYKSQKRESVEAKELGRLIFEGQLAVFESDIDDMISKAICLFMNDDGIDRAKQKKIVQKLKDDKSVNDNDVKLQKIPSKAFLCTLLDYAKTKEELKKVFSKYRAHLEKITKLLAKLETYLAEELNEKDDDSSEDSNFIQKADDLKKDLYIVVKHNLARADDEDKKSEEK